MAQKLLKKRAPYDEIITINFPLLTGSFKTYIKRAICERIGCQTKGLWQEKLNIYLSNHRIIFVLDQTEAAIYQQPEVFEYLRHLRDFYPQKIGFLLIADYRIITDFQKWIDVGGILFNRIVQIPPFDLPGTDRILNTNRFVSDQPYSTQTINTIFKLSGGNPALIKYLGIAYQDTNDLKNIGGLINSPGLAVKLNDIAVLVFSESTENLKSLGILNEELKLFSPLLTEYIKRYQMENIDEIIPNLTIQEKRILTYLLKNKGKLLNKDRLAMLMKLTDETYSLWAMYKAISRLKRKLKGKYQIKTSKGQGYLLLTF